MLDVIISRHAPFDPGAVATHLRPGGYFITQQVGERNMACVKAALAGNVHGRGFVTNEHRYLAATQNARPETGMHAQSGQ